jgi:hypothetical protein
MNPAFRKASKSEDENSTMKFRSLASFEKAFLHFMGLLSRLPNEIDFEQIETALKTILSEKKCAKHGNRYEGKPGTSALRFTGIDS